jgi:hypothetical protein
LVSFLDGTLIVVLPLNITTAHASGSGGHEVVVQKNVSVLTIGGHWDSRGIRGKSFAASVQGCRAQKCKRMSYSLSSDPEANPEPGDNARQGAVKDDASEERRPRRTQTEGGADMHGVNSFDARRRVQQNGKKRAEPDDECILRVTDAKLQDADRNPS